MSRLIRNQFVANIPPQDDDDEDFYDVEDFCDDEEAEEFEEEDDEVNEPHYFGSATPAGNEEAYVPPSVFDDIDRDAAVEARKARKRSKPITPSYAFNEEGTVFGFAEAPSPEDSVSGDEEPPVPPSLW